MEDKKAKIDELEQQVTEIKEDLQNLYTTISLIRDRLTTGDFLPKDLSEDAQKQLTSVDKKQEQCESMLKEIRENAQLPDSIEEFETELKQMKESLSLEEEMNKVKRFLLLDSEVASLRGTLRKEQRTLEMLLSYGAKANDQDILPYKTFMEGFDQRDDAMSAMNSIFALKGHFDDDLLAHTFIQKDVYLRADWKLSDVYHTFSYDPPEDAVQPDTEQISDEVLESILDSSDEYSSAKSAESEAVENTADKETIEEEVSEKVPSMEGTVHVSPDTVPDKYKDYTVLVSKSPRENKKFGASEFINDLGKFRYGASAAFAMSILNNFHCTTPEILSLLSGKKTDECETALDFLQNKGYVRRYGFLGVNGFYELTDRGLKVFTSQKANKFLRFPTKSKGSYWETAESVRSILSRYMYLRLIYECLKTIGQGRNEWKIYCMFDESAFTVALKLTFPEGNRYYVLAGCATENHDEYGDWINEFETIRDDMRTLCAKEEEHGSSYTLEYIFAGYDKKDAIRYIEDIHSEDAFDNNDSVHAYSYSEDKYYELSAEEEVSAAEVYDHSFDIEADDEKGDAQEEIPDQETEGSSEPIAEVSKTFSSEDEVRNAESSTPSSGEMSTETAASGTVESSDNVEKGEQASANEAIVKNNVVNDNAIQKKASTLAADNHTAFRKVSFTSEAPTAIGKATFDPAAEQSTDAVSAPIVPKMSLDEITRDEYDMLNSGRIYCATAFLKAVDASQKSEEVHDMYRKLAYAVNDPRHACDYDSEHVIDIYIAGEESAFNQYLAVSASLRTFFSDEHSYDYSIQQLTGILNKYDIMSTFSHVNNVVFELSEFKKRYQKGMDAYALYRSKNRKNIENEMLKCTKKADEYIHIYVDTRFKKSQNNHRYSLTREHIFDPKGDLAYGLELVKEKKYDPESVELISGILKDHFLKDGAEIATGSVDQNKIIAYINHYWDETAKEKKILAVKNSSDLKGNYRNTLVNAVKRITDLLCEWVVLVKSSRINGAGDAETYFSGKKDYLLNILDDAEKEVSAKSDDPAIMAGRAVLYSTLDELRRRIDGTYDAKEHDYFYIDFLKEPYVLLDENYFPEITGVFAQDAQFSSLTGIRDHLAHPEESFMQRLDEIFRGGDDYGSAKLIANYLKETAAVTDEDLEKYDFTESIQKAAQDAERRKDDFIGNLELAQSFGQLNMGNNENQKEAILRIVDRWYEYAQKSNNYGYFSKVLDLYLGRVKKEAKGQESTLLKQLNEYKTSRKLNSDPEKVQKAIGEVEKMIEKQNYSVAEDILTRMASGDFSENTVFFQNGYLEDFFDPMTYEKNYRMVSSGQKSFKALMHLDRTRNKEDRGRQVLINQWITNSTGNMDKVRQLMGQLGFDVKEVRALPKIKNQWESFRVMLNQPENGRRSSFKHPIAAFGSQAIDHGFRVITISGNYSADGLMQIMQDSGDTAHTIILLDWALKITERRKLARLTKKAAMNHVFGVIDRVMMVYLVDNYSAMTISDMLMSVMMPFAYYQPYVLDSNANMPPEMFMGRKKELNNIKDPNGANIVFGGRQLGKSALLRMARFDVDHDENGDRAVLVDIKNCDYKKAAKKISSALYEADILAEDLGTESWEDLSTAIRRRLMDQKNQIPYFLLLLDEADAFIDSCEAVNYSPFDCLKDIQNVGPGRFKFVVAGLRNVVRFNREIALGNNSVLPQLQSITVKPFGVSEAQELLEVPLYYLGFRFDEKDMSLIYLILANANYFPGLIQFYCAKIVEAMQKDYADYAESQTPPYIMTPDHIKNVLASKGFRDQIYQKFDITLKLGDDNYYYTIALVVASLTHDHPDRNGFTVEEIQEEADENMLHTLSDLPTEKIEALILEMCDLNILRTTASDQEYCFTRHSFFQMMGTKKEIDDKMEELMED